MRHRAPAGSFLLGAGGRAQTYPESSKASSDGMKLASLPSAPGSVVPVKLANHRKLQGALGCEELSGRCLQAVVPSVGLLGESL